ncbi:protein of unknown function [Caballeronia sp. S22]
MLVRVSRVSHKSDISVQGGIKRTPFYLTLHAKTPSRVLLQRHERRVSECSIALRVRRRARSARFFGVRSVIAQKQKTPLRPASCRANGVCHAKDQASPIIRVRFACRA